MLHLAEETKLFDFLSRVNFPLISAQVVFLFHGADFEGQFIVSVISKILSFHRKFSYQNVDYVKLASIKI